MSREILFNLFWFLLLSGFRCESSVSTTSSQKQATTQSLEPSETDDGDWWWPDLPTELPTLPDISLDIPDLPSIDWPSIPTEVPNILPTEFPNIFPTELPTLPNSIDIPNLIPTDLPNLIPTDLTNLIPTDLPNLIPTDLPSYSEVLEAALASLTCPSEQDPDYGEWPSASVLEVVFLSCPPGYKGWVARFCKLKIEYLTAEWSQPNSKACISNETIDNFISEVADYFSNSSVNSLKAQATEFLVDQLASSTTLLMEKAESLNDKDLHTINLVLRNVLELIDELERNWNTFDYQTIMGLLSNVLDERNKDGWNQLQMSDAGSEESLYISENFGFYLGKLAVNSSTSFLVLSWKNIDIQVIHLNADSAEIADVTYPLKTEQSFNSSTSTTNLVSMKIPSAFLKKIIESSNSDVSVVHMYFPSLHKIFPHSQKNSKLASVIISSQVFATGSNSSYNRTTVESVLKNNPIEITFSLILEELPAISPNERLTYSCAYWKFSEKFNSSSAGEWLSDGIQTKISDSNTIKCLAQHLTSFAVLVKVVPNEELELNSTITKQTNLEELVHEVISYIGTSISILCLMLTIIWLLSLGKSLFSEVHNFIHLGLSISLLLGLIVFVSGIKFASSIKPVCKLVAVLLHYLFLSAFCWMLCEAIMLFLMLVIVFTTLTKKWWLFCIIGWGLPLIPVAVTFGIGFKNYNPESEICWLNSANHLIWGFVGPIIPIILANGVILVIVLVKIFQSRKSKMKGISEKSKSSNAEVRQTAIHLIRGGLVLLPLLGLTWIIGVFAIDSNTKVFEWLFTILNSLQGAFIFIFHVLMSKRFNAKVKKIYMKKIQKQSQSSRSTYSFRKESTLTTRIESEIGSKNIAPDDFTF